MSNYVCSVYYAKIILPLRGAPLTDSNSKKMHYRTSEKKIKCPFLSTFTYYMFYVMRYEF